MRTPSILLVAMLLALPLPGQQEPPAEPARPATPAAAAEPPGEPEPAPRLVVPRSEIDVGAVQRGDKVRVEFELENHGDADLAIRSVQPACGCTVASFHNKIEPGGSGKVTAIVDTKSFTGAISKGMTVISNDPVAPRTVLTVKAEVLAHVIASPSYARFVHTQTLEPPTTGLTVWSSDREDFRLLGVRSPVAWVTAEVREATENERMSEAPGAQWRVVVSLADDAPVGQLREFLVVETNHPDQPTLEVPLSGVVRPVLHLTPARADFGSFVLAGQARELVLNLINFGRDPVEVRAVTTDVEGVSVRAEEVKSGRRWRIVVEASASLDKGRLAGHLRIETSSPTLPELEIPLEGKVG